MKDFPAFPAPDKARDDFGANKRGAYAGMTLRDFFASKAMPIVCSMESDKSYKEDAISAYLFADAMMKAREMK